MVAEGRRPPGGLGTLIEVTPDQELVLLFGGLHLVALALGGALFAMLFRSEPVTPWRPADEEDDSGGGSDRLAPGPRGGGPRDGVPLPDAEQAPVRLRENGRLADAYPFPRRREHAPAPARPNVPAP